MAKTRKRILTILTLVIIATGAVWTYFFFWPWEPEIDEVPGTLVTKSHEAILGAIGYKEQTQMQGETRWFFERMVVPAWNGLEVHNAGAVTRSESEIRRLEELGLSSVTRAFLETRGKHDSTRGYRLVTLQIRDAESVARELLELSKTNAYLRSILRQRGVRIVREVDQVFDHETTNEMEAKTKASATISKARDTDVQLSFRAERNSAVKISDGSVVSYRLALLCWDSDGALQMRLDHQGSGCPAGFSETLPDSVQMADIVRSIPNSAEDVPVKPTAPVKTDTAVADDTPSPEECPNIGGWWVREIDGARLLIRQNRCTIAADAPTGPFAHVFRGLYTDDHFQYVVKRRNNSTGCETRMYGNIEVLAPERIRVVVAATDGKCDLAANFWEDLIWQREPVPSGDGTVSPPKAERAIESGG